MKREDLPHDTKLWQLLFITGIALVVLTLTNLVRRLLGKEPIM
jgi:hypothetical protein